MMKKILSILLTFIIIVGYSQTVKNKGTISQGLISFYPLNEGGGSIAFDMNKVLNLSLSASEWTNLDKTMYIHTNGNSCSATVPDNTPLDIRTNRISFGGWVYPIVSNVYQVICGKILDQSQRQYALYLSATGTTGLYMSLNGVWTNQAITTSKQWEVNKWNHIILTYDGATIVVYVNGVAGYSIAKTGNITNVPLSKFQIGAEGTPSFSWFRCTGRLGAMGVWGRALTFSEVQYWYRLGPYSNPFK